MVRPRWPLFCVAPTTHSCHCHHPAFCCNIGAFGSPVRFAGPGVFPDPTGRRHGGQNDLGRRPRPAGGGPGSLRTQPAKTSRRGKNGLRFLQTPNGPGKNLAFGSNSTPTRGAKTRRLNAVNFPKPPPHADQLPRDPTGRAANLRPNRLVARLLPAEPAKHRLNHALTTVLRFRSRFFARPCRPNSTWKTSLPQAGKPTPGGDLTRARGKNSPFGPPPANEAAWAPQEPRLLLSQLNKHPPSPIPFEKNAPRRTKIAVRECPASVPAGQPSEPKRGAIEGRLSRNRGEWLWPQPEPCQQPAIRLMPC